MFTQPIRQILFATDFSASATAAGEVAHEMARRYRAQLHVLHVVEGAPAEDGLAPLRAAAAPLAVGLARRPILVVDHGTAAAGIVRYARQRAIDLVVVGTRGGTRRSWLVHGSVAASVMRNAPCTVLTVKAPAAVATPAESAPPRRPCYLCAARELGPICPLCSARVTGEIRERWQQGLRPT